LNFVAERYRVTLDVRESDNLALTAIHNLTLPNKPCGAVHHEMDTSELNLTPTTKGLQLDSAGREGRSLLQNRRQGQDPYNKGSYEHNAARNVLQQGPRNLVSKFVLHSLLVGNPIN
jgi:hypothetical protein